MKAAPRLAGLDALRGIAALLVMGLHANAVFHGLEPFSKGYLGVDFFLMLSGFLMARITEPRLADGMAPQQFMVARYKRFWGMVALGSLIGLPYLWVRSGAEWWPFLPALIANFALLPWPVANLLFALNIPAWTIFAELVANAAHVFALRRLPNTALAALTALLGGLTIWVAVAWARSMSGRGRATSGPQSPACSSPIAWASASGAGGRNGSCWPCPRPSCWLPCP